MTAAYDALLVDPRASLGWLIEFTAHNVATDLDETVRLSTFGFTSEPSDTPANEPYEARVKSALNFERHMYRRGGRIGRSSQPSFGEIVLVNLDRALTKYTNPAQYLIRGRKVTAMLGGTEDYALVDFGTPLKEGRVKDFVARNGQLRLLIRDLQELFERAVQPNKYAGTGGNEGGAELKDKNKPIGYGDIFNCPGVPIDPANGVWQLHDGKIKSLKAVRDKGLVKTLTTDYTVDLNTGLVTLLFTPTDVRFDFEGDNTGSVYVESFADILERVVEAITGLTVNSTAVTTMNTANSAPCNYWCGTEKISIRQMLDDLADGPGAFFGDNFNAQVDLGRLEAPSGTPAIEFFGNQGIASGNVNNILAGTLEPVATVEPCHTLRQAYQRNWGVQSRDSLDASVSEADKDKYSTEWRFKSDSDATVLDDYPEAKEQTWYGGFSNAADADTESQRKFALYKVAQEVFKFTARAIPFKLGINDVIKITHTDHNLSTGKLFRVLGLAIDADSRKVEVWVWRPST
ncbi:MAG TPA: hypothetical protein ENI80_03585 [Acidiferrobacteraceae bacterium]|nr:hypothetical protein [Acidiferrobacteraceae bacterium]